MPLLNILHFVILVVSSYFLLNTISNIIYLKYQSKKPSVKKGPKISVLVPARNEEENIRACLEYLLDQDYENYEILVMNDNSTDRTGEILDEMAREYPRLRIYNGAPLKEGWFGKPYALQQLCEYADGDYFLFSDADTIHSRTSLSFCMTNALYHKTDLLSAYPRELIGTFGEVMNVSAMFLMTSIIMPLPAIDLWKWKHASFCLGQYFFIRSDVFRKIGGFEPVKHAITEDVAFGKVVKSLGYKTKFLDAQPHVACQMYKSFGESFKGIGKNVYDAVGKNLLLFGGIIILIGLIEYPVVRLLAGLVTAQGVPGMVAASVILFFLMWLLVVLDRKIPLYGAILYPAQYFLILAMVVYFRFQFRSGKGIVWKNRTMGR
ncbi:MAG: glycosyltransferase family 2 protein [Spirochaetales bacterium]|nr:glycosyltransferase family 2 protein [Spirochaetales bacterium]